MSSHVLRRPQSLRRWQVRGLAATTGIMLGLGLAELLLRVFGFGTPPWSVVIHPFRGRSYRPDSTFVFRGEGGPRQIVLNSRGFRDLTRTPDKPAGIFRIAVLGDSYVEASHVDIADRVTERLERELNQRSVFGTSRVEVLNFGMAGYGTFNELQTLKHEAWNFQPDLVLVCFFSGNDLGNNCRELSQDSGRPYLVWRHDHFDELFPTAPRFSLRESILQSSHLFRLWTSVWEQRRESRKRSPQRQRQSPPHATSTESFEVGLDTQIYSPPKRPPGSRPGRSLRNFCGDLTRSAGPGRPRGCWWCCPTESRSIPIEISANRSGRRWNIPHSFTRKNACGKPPNGMATQFSAWPRNC